MDQVVYEVLRDGVVAATYSGERQDVLRQIREFEASHTGTIEAREVAPS